MRAVLDVNVLISALLAPGGGSAALLLRWLNGEFELVVSDELLAELERALAYPKVRRLVPEEDARAFVELLRRSAVIAAPSLEPPTLRSRDPADDYLLALSHAGDAFLVTWDRDLLDLGHNLIGTPASFLAELVTRQL